MESTVLKRTLPMLAALGLMVILSLPLRAADPPRTAELEARANAFLMLYQQLNQLQVTPDIRVADFLAVSPDIRAFTYDAIRRNAQTTAVQTYSDAAVAVQVQLSIREVVRTLAEACKSLYEGTKFQPQDFEKILLYTDREGLWGFGQSRGEPPSGIAAGSPVGWYDVGVFGRLKARHQACENAYRQLLNRIRALRLSPTRQVGEFMASDKRIAADIETFIRAHPISAEAHYLPERLCEVEATIDLPELIAEFKSLANAYNTGSEFLPESFNAIGMYFTEPKLKVIGGAVPPSEAEAQPVAEEVWTRTAKADPPDSVEDAQQAKLLAAKAAQASAREQLRKAILSELAPGGAKEADALAKNPTVQADIDALLINLRMVQIRNLKESSVEVTVELPIARLRALVEHYRDKNIIPANKP
jgi:hypothetical protein